VGILIGILDLLIISEQLEGLYVARGGLVSFSKQRVKVKSTVNITAKVPQLQ
jgi:hypothetical protein